MRRESTKSIFKTVYQATALIERTPRGDLIEVFKAKKEFSSINGVFKFSRSGRILFQHLIIMTAQLNLGN